jgi:predicted adenylyl cyclase CyaB
MQGISFEIKAKCQDPKRIRNILKSEGANFKGLDHQIDTYFRVPSGRLKLREGNIENALIYYKRSDQKNSKRCDSVLYRGPDGQALKKVLTAACGVFAVVDKRREIYFLKNVKFHIDKVKGLGSFVEIEVFGPAGAASQGKLRKQCEAAQALLGIRKKDLLADSYSDRVRKPQPRR